jgi:hypothetical protein
MARRLSAAIAALILILIIFSGCVGNSPTTPSAFSENSAIPQMDAVSAFSLYCNVKSQSFDRLLAKFDPDPDFYMQYSDKFMPAGRSDIPLITLTAMENDEDALNTVESMGYLNYESVKTDHGYDMSYTGPDGIEYKQTCIYDPAAEYMQSVTTDAQGNVTLFFEYLKTDKGYVSQYFTNQQNDFSLIKGYVGDPDIVAFGLEPAEAVPESISGKADINSGFVKNDNIYFIVEVDKLTIGEYGEAAVY